MVWWVVSGVLALAVVVFLAVVAVLVRRARPLKRELDRLRTQAERAQRLQAKSEETQKRATALQDRLEEMTARLQPPGGSSGSR